ncbi:MAG: nuclear transport factor 2 family protein [Acidobacteriota bacterium]|nr:nuclear transport factor 2 family protein [Acidobacteriota bacterium]MDH3786152.1 nuclear transport factor 2 family protein [Acidobacteriota bacterium]
MKRTLILIVLATLTGSLHAAPSPEQVVDRYFDAYRDADVVTMTALYDEDAVFEDVNQRHHLEGREQIGQLLGTLVAMHLQMDLKESRRVVQGNTVVVEYAYTGQLNGKALGHSVGKESCPDLEYSLPTTSWYQVENGRIVSHKDFIDLATYKELQAQMLAAGE